MALAPAPHTAKPMRLLHSVAIACCLACLPTACATMQPPAAHPAILGSATFASAGGTEIRAEYRADATVRLTFSGGATQVLNQAVSGSGIRFVSGNDEWWEHQGEASYRRDGTLVFNGRRK